LSKAKAISETHTGIGKGVFHRPAFYSQIAGSEQLPGYGPHAAFSVCQNVEAIGHDSLEEGGAPSSGIEDHGAAALTDQRADLGENRRKHFDEPCVCHGCEDEEGVARGVIDPVVRSRGHLWLARDFDEALPEE